MASTSALPVGDQENAFGTLALPPLLNNVTVSDDTIFNRGSLEVIEFRLLSDLEYFMCIPKESIDSYAKKYRRNQLLVTGGFMPDPIECDEASESLLLPDVACLPTDKITKETAHRVTEVLRCFLALGGSEEKIFDYLIRQFGLLCQGNDAHRHDVAFVFSALAQVALERHLCSSKNHDNLVDKFYKDRRFFVGALRDVLNFIVIATQKTSVGAPFAIDSPTRKELCDILRRLWFWPKEGAALFYAHVFWTICGSVLESDNPMLHPLNAYPLDDRRECMRECAETAKYPTLMKWVPNWIYGNLILNENFECPEVREDDYLLHAKRCMEIFGYSPKASSPPAPENRFAPLPEEDEKDEEECCGWCCCF